MAFHVYPVVLFGLNFIFALLYYTIGIEHLNGIDATGSDLGLDQAYFFSAQTFTVGYGHISQ
jgi:inward rectifier potassium channel